MIERAVIECVAELPAGPCVELQFREDLAHFERAEKPMTIDMPLSPVELAVLSQERQEGRQEGVLQGLQASTLDALEARSGPLPPGAQNRVQSLQEETDLRQAHRLAITAPSVEHLLQTV